jgi:hypothetical protein
LAVCNTNHFQACKVQRIACCNPFLCLFHQNLLVSAIVCNRPLDRHPVKNSKVFWWIFLLGVYHLISTCLYFPCTLRIVSPTLKGFRGSTWLTFPVSQPGKLVQRVIWDSYNFICFLWPDIQNLKNNSFVYFVDFLVYLSKR